jgi:hypothetical protein
MIRLMVYAEDAQEKVSTYNTKDVVHVVILKPNLEDVLII